MSKILSAILLSLFLSNCSPTTYTEGVPNLVKVNNEVWRSGQPTTLAQWQFLHNDLGINYDIKLNFESEGSDKDAIAAGITVYTFSIQPEGDKDIWDNILNTFVEPDETTLNEIESAIEFGSGVLVHCTHGQDRTGLVIGRYRVLHDNWSKNVAYSEMIANNFHPDLMGLMYYWLDFDPPMQSDAAVDQ